MIKIVTEGNAPIMSEDNMLQMATTAIHSYLVSLTDTRDASAKTEIVNEVDELLDNITKDTFQKFKAYCLKNNVPGEQLYAKANTWKEFKQLVENSNI